jgi:hypothetical protein
MHRNWATAIAFPADKVTTCMGLLEERQREREYVLFQIPRPDKMESGIPLAHPVCRLSAGHNPGASHALGAPAASSAPLCTCWCSPAVGRVQARVSPTSQHHKLQITFFTPEGLGGKWSSYPATRERLGRFKPHTYPQMEKQIRGRDDKARFTTS